MSYHPRIEAPVLANFITTRSSESRLWFVNNQPLETAILGFAAKYAERYGVKLYALAIEGNHIQATTLFPNSNRSDFMRDFNSSVAKAVTRLTPMTCGRLWARRYSNEFVPGAEDVKNQFFYTVLQPVQDGLVEKISEYPGYNCFSDAVSGRKRRFSVVRWTEYNAKKRWNPELKVTDFTDTVYLKYERLPGYEHFEQKEYAKEMQRELEKRRCEIVAKRRAAGLGFAGRANLLKTVPGALPMTTKVSTIESHRPRVLSVCDQRRADCKAWYFSIYFAYKKSSREYRAGKRDVVFPKGTYPPYLHCKQALAA